MNERDTRNEFPFPQMDLARNSSILSAAAYAVDCQDINPNLNYTAVRFFLLLSKCSRHFFFYPNNRIKAFWKRLAFLAAWIWRNKWYRIMLFGHFTLLVNSRFSQTSLKLKPLRERRDFLLVRSKSLYRLYCFFLRFPKKRENVKTFFSFSVCDRTGPDVGMQGRTSEEDQTWPQQQKDLIQLGKCLKG